MIATQALRTLRNASTLYVALQKSMPKKEYWIWIWILMPTKFTTAHTVCQWLRITNEIKPTSTLIYQTGNSSNAKVSAFFAIYRDLFDFDCHMKVITSHKLHRRKWKKKSCNRKNKKRSNECQPTFGCKIDSSKIGPWKIVSSLWQKCERKSQTIWIQLKNE